MLTDFRTFIGAAHHAAGKPCQDYARAGRTSRGGFAIVADGCSTGGQTELGARAWTAAAFRVLSTSENVFNFAEDLQNAVVDEVQPFLAPLPPEDGYSTVVMAQVQGRHVQITALGDGAVLARHFDGSVTLTNVQYSNSAPFYPNYLLHPELLRQWRERCGQQERNIVSTRFDADGAMSGLTVGKADAETALWLLDADVDEREIELLLVCTDGIGTAGSGLYASARELAGVRSAEEFLQGHVDGLIRRWEAVNAMPTDDLAVAGFWLGA